jgi:hypothetical protein
LKREKIVKKYFILFALILIQGCGGGGDSGGDGSVSSLTGQFVDSPVEGVSYVAGGFSGTTAADGSFTYGSGNNLLLSIGDISLGDGIARNTFTPLTLVGTTNPSDANVVNIASFLLTLDDDGDPNNGILITEAVRTAAIGKTINFAQSTTDFTNDGNVQTVVAELTALTTAGARSLVSAAYAEAHLRSTLNDILEAALGTYTGTGFNTISNCDDPSLNRTNLSTGSLTIDTVSLNLNGATFTGQGSFSLTVEGVTLREDFTIFANSSTMDFAGTLNGTINSTAYVDGEYYTSASSSYTGLLDGNSLTIVTPEQLDVLTVLGVCDFSGTTLDLAKTTSSDSDVIGCNLPSELEGPWDATLIEGALDPDGNPLVVDGSVSSLEFFCDGTYTWFLNAPPWYDLNSGGNVIFSDSTLYFTGALNDFLGVPTVNYSVGDTDITFLDEDGDRWRYHKRN